MFKKLILPGVLSLLISSTAFAESYWLNIVGTSTMSIPTPSETSCNDAIHAYVRSEMVNFISCDVQPLPGAENLGLKR